MQLVTLSDLESATNADIFNGTRLNTIDSRGKIRFEMSASANSATNYFTVSVKMPGGDIPLETVRVPASATAGSLDSRETLSFTLPVKAGGPPTFSATLTGTATLAWRATYVGV